MRCIKCGREIREPQVFCDLCLAEMEKYPVKPNITVQLPVRPAAAPAKKKAKRQKYTKPEEQIRYLRSKVRWISLALAVTLVAFAVTAAVALQLLDQRDSGYGVGQNYGTMDSVNGT